MKISELDDKLLTDDEKYMLVMRGIKDYELIKPNDNTKSDLIVVLGCSPIPLEDRVKKMMGLYRLGYSNNILLSGGNGWKKLYKKKDPQTGEEYVDEEKWKQLLEAIRTTIGANLLGNNPSKKELELFDRFNEGMKEMMHVDSMPSYEEQQEKKNMNLNEAEFMKLIILTNGGLKGAHIFHEPFSFNTKDNMQYTKKYIESLLKTGELKELKRIMVVTSSFHCQRARLTFKKYFPNVEILTCPSTLDFQRIGSELGPNMMKNSYYKKQIINECNALINYSKNGSIADEEVGAILDNSEIEI